MGYKEKLAAATAAAAPSLVPAPRDEPQQREDLDAPPPPPKEEIVIPDIGDIVKDRKVRLEIARMVERHGELGTELKPLNKERKILTDKLKKLVGTYSIGKAVCGLWRINYYDSPRTKLDEDKLVRTLMEQGVQPNVITKALTAAKTTKPSYTLKITAQGEDEEDE